MSKLIYVNFSIIFRIYLNSLLNLSNFQSSIHLEKGFSLILFLPLGRNQLEAHLYPQPLSWAGPTASPLYSFPSSFIPTLGSRSYGPKCIPLHPSLPPLPEWLPCGARPSSLSPSPGRRPTPDRAACAASTAPEPPRLAPQLPRLLHPASPLLPRTLSPRPYGPRRKGRAARNRTAAAGPRSCCAALGYKSPEPLASRGSHPSSPPNPKIPSPIFLSTSLIPPISVAGRRPIFRVASPPVSLSLQFLTPIYSSRPRLPPGQGPVVDASRWPHDPTAMPSAPSAAARRRAPASLLRPSSVPVDA